MTKISRDAAVLEIIKGFIDHVATNGGTTRYTTLRDDSTQKVLVFEFAIMIEGMGQAKPMELWLSFSSADGLLIINGGIPILIATDPDTTFRICQNLYSEDAVFYGRVEISPLPDNGHILYYRQFQFFNYSTFKDPVLAGEFVGSLVASAQKDMTRVVQKFCQIATNIKPPATSKLH